MMDTRMTMQHQVMASQTIQGIDITDQIGFAEAVTMLKEVQRQVDAAWKAVEAQMKAHSVTALKGEWGTISLAERKTWKVNLDLLNETYTKRVADTRKLNAAWDSNELPEGADFTTSIYLTKRIKEFTTRDVSHD